MTDQLSNFYNTLFGVEITVFGTITAAIFVFAQLVYSSFPHSHLGFIFKNWTIRILTGLVVLDTLATAVGSYLSSIPSHNIFPRWDLHSHIIVANEWYVLACLILFLTSIGLFIFLIFKNIGYLKPSRVLLLSAQSIDYESVRKFILNKFGLTSPSDPQYNIVLARYSILAEEEKIDEEQAKRDAAKRQMILENNLNEYQKLKEDIKPHTEDPLSAIHEIALRAINNVDINTLRETGKSLCDIAEEFFPKIPKKKEWNDWFPDSDLAINFSTHLLELLNLQLEACAAKGINAMALEVLSVSQSVALAALKNCRIDALIQIEVFWKATALGAIGKSSEVFKAIISFYRDVADELFKLDKPDKEAAEAIDNVFRELGWLGEKFLSQQAPSAPPLMADFDYSTEYDALLEALLRYDDHFISKIHDISPIIYFDAIEVVLRKVADVYSKDKSNRRLSENIFSLAYVFYLVAEKALQEGSASRASLSYIELKKVYEFLSSFSLSKEAGDIVGLITSLGIKAAGRKKTLQDKPYTTRPLDEEILEFLAKNPLAGKIREEIFEQYLKVDPGRDSNAVWDFIVKLGMRMRTNFRLNFDPVTGERGKA